MIDPNDPRNAPLLELLKTHEAAASALGDLFRLDIFPDVAMQVGWKGGGVGQCVCEGWGVQLLDCLCWLVAPI